MSKKPHGMTSDGSKRKRSAFWLPRAIACLGTISGSTLRRRARSGCMCAGTWFPSAIRPGMCA